jgi:hypothetical protein
MTIGFRPRDFSLPTVYSGRSTTRAARLAVVCLALCAVVAGSAEAWQNRGETKGKGKRKPASSASPKRPAPAAPKAKKGTDEAEEDAEQERKLHDLKANVQLPRLKELQVPTVAQLRASPVDWLVLKGVEKSSGKAANNNKWADAARELVIVVKPVFPRPDTLKKLQTALEELRKAPSGETAAQREKRAAQRKELANLVVTLPDDPEVQLYEIPTNVIDFIVYHEDLIVRRAALLIDEGKFREAYELLFALNRQARDWPGIREQTLRLEYLEATRSLEAGDLESALTTLINLEL